MLILSQNIKSAVTGSKEYLGKNVERCCLVRCIALQACMLIKMFPRYPLYIKNILAVFDLSTFNISEIFFLKYQWMCSFC